MKISYKKTKSINIKKNTLYTLIIGIFSGFMILFFGGIGDYTHHEFGRALVQSPLWFSATLAWIGFSIIILSIGYYFFTIYYRYNHKQKKIERKEFEALNLSLLGLAMAPVFIYTWQVIIFASFTNQSFEFIINSSNYAFFSIFAPFVLAIFIFSISLGIYWKYYRKSKNEKMYAWTRNVLLSYSSLSFLLYFTGIAGLGAFGFDLSRFDPTAEMYEDINLWKLDLAISWDNAPGWVKNTLSTGLNDATNGISYSATMSGTDFVDTLFNDARFEGLNYQSLNSYLDEIAYPSKNLFFGVNNNWQSYILFTLIITVTLSPVLLLYKLWKNENNDSINFDGTKFTWNALIILISITGLIFFIDNNIIVNIKPEWDPGLYNQPIDLMTADYVGTVYWWIVFSIMILMPSIALNIWVVKRKDTNKKESLKEFDLNKEFNEKIAKEINKK